MKRLRILILFVGILFSFQLECSKTFASTSSKIPVEGIIKKQQGSDEKIVSNHADLLPQLSDDSTESNLLSLVGGGLIILAIGFEIFRRKNANEKV